MPKGANTRLSAVPRQRRRELVLALLLSCSAAIPAQASEPLPVGDVAGGRPEVEAATSAGTGTTPAVPDPAPEASVSRVEGKSEDTPPPGENPQDEITVTARQNTPGDPLAGLNAQSFEAIQAVDDAVIGPVATGYQKGAPKPLRQGLRNFLRHVEEPVIGLNYLLQLKIGRAFKSVGRFVVNSTFGVVGLVDVAKTKPFNLPYTPNGFANTFACYGIGPGPYFFLPLIGPTTLRDVIGVSMDRLAVPTVVGKPFSKPYYAIPANVIDSLNDRIDIDAQLKKTREESSNPYVATRDLYLRQRKAEIAAICPRKGDVADPTLPPRAGKGRN